MHAFLCVHGRPLIHGERLREFIHRPQFEKGCYVWQNRELTPAEHEKVARKVVEQNADLRPYTRFVLSAAESGKDQRIVELEAQVARNADEIGKLRRSLTAPRRARD